MILNKRVSWGILYAVGNYNKERWQSKRIHTNLGFHIDSVFEMYCRLVTSGEVAALVLSSLLLNDAHRQMFKLAVVINDNTFHATGRICL